MRNSLVNYIVAFSHNMLSLIMCVLYAIAYLFVRILPVAVLTFWGSLGVFALGKATGDSELVNMPVGRIALIGVVATIAAIILGVAATTLLDSITTEDDADTE